KSLEKSDAEEVVQAGLLEEVIVKGYALEQNYPNPFNPATTIRYALPKDGAVRLTIYNLLGQEVTTLVNEYKLKGRYEVKFDASNLSSGMYIYRIESGSFSDSKRMMLVK
ncbi:MAG: T9SS type A sorting domain-containing protein, partial [Candidatus Moranbacteria bacterium]|nr:T9SS type A sorting domain-containing protein [Candidatus Moranbacteria bacterium]